MCYFLCLEHIFLTFFASKCLFFIHQCHHKNNKFLKSKKSLFSLKTLFPFHFLQAALLTLPHTIQVEVLHSALPTPQTYVYDHNWPSKRYFSVHFSTLPTRQSAPWEQKFKLSSQETRRPLAVARLGGRVDNVALGAKANSRQFPKQNRLKNGVNWWAEKRTRCRWMEARWSQWAKAGKRGIIRKSIHPHYTKGGGLVECLRPSGQRGGKCSEPRSVRL